MLSTLLESRPQRSSSRGAGATSLIAHTLAITAAVLATAATQGTGTPPDPPPVLIYRLPPAPPVAAPAVPAAPVTPEHTSPAPSLPALPVPVVTPVGIPAPAPTAVGTSTIPFTAGPLATAPAAGPAGDGLPGGTAPYSELTVDRPARPVPGTMRPRYPDLLRRDRVEGAVRATYVVDTLGRVEPGSFQVLDSAHPLFERAVRDALGAMRFVPAQAGGRRVRQLVEQRFLFTLRR